MGLGIPQVTIAEFVDSIICGNAACDFTDAVHHFNKR
jgi:hypothetical protein